MNEKTREVPQLADATYANTLVIEWPMDLVFMSTFDIEGYNG